MTHYLFDLEIFSKEGGLIGVDEAGRGPLAGPVVAAAVCMPLGQPPLLGVDDSKILTPKLREELYGKIKQNAVFWSVRGIGPDEIDRINIRQATLKAMTLTLSVLPIRGELVLIDGRDSLPGYLGKQRSLIGGDSLSYHIACASIMAKVTRDRWMSYYDPLFPEFGFKKHKGYGTKIHLDALKKHGPTPIHRLSYRPVRESIP